MSLSDPPGAPEPEPLAEAGVYATAEEGFEHGLVVLAMGRPFWLVASGSAHRLLVEPEILDAALEQLALFNRESAGWPPAGPAERPHPARRADLTTPLVWAATVSAAYWDQVRFPGRWEDWGSLDSQGIFARGEWWRPASALFLHADLGHLLSNLLSGVFVFSAVATTLGRARGWILLALSSVAANLAAAALHRGSAYTSLGASTAIFAGLGLLTGRAAELVSRGGHPHPWRAMLAPVGAGTGLLALYGAGGPGVDLSAHVCGFASGLVAGFFFARAPARA